MLSKQLHDTDQCVCTLITTGGGTIAERKAALLGGRAPEAGHSTHRTGKQEPCCSHLSVCLDTVQETMDAQAQLLDSKVPTQVYRNQVVAVCLCVWILYRKQSMLRRSCLTAKCPRRYTGTK